MNVETYYKIPYQSFGNHAGVTRLTDDHEIVRKVHGRLNVVIQVRSFPSPGINCKTNDVSVKNLLHKDEARLIPRM